MANLEKKITVKTVCGKIKDVLPKEFKKEIPLMRVVGMVRSYSTPDTEYGPYLRLKGSFEATNILTGEVARSGTCILPEVASDALEAVLMDDDIKTVNFGFDIGVKPSDIPIGYEFTATPLIESNDMDPLQQLSNSISKALPKPAK
jgi:hypothetical protein